MSRHHRIQALQCLSAFVLGFSLLAATAPVQASEVVKLARLLITGKRAPSKPPVSPQPSPGDRGGSTDNPGPQSRLMDTDGEAAGHAADEHRGSRTVLAADTLTLTVD